MTDKRNNILLILHDGNELPSPLNELSGKYSVVSHNLDKSGQLIKEIDPPDIVLFYTLDLKESFILQSERVIKSLKVPSVLLIGFEPSIDKLERVSQGTYSFIIYPPYSLLTIEMTIQKLLEFTDFVSEIGLESKPPDESGMISAPVLGQLKKKANSLFREMESSARMREELKMKSEKLAQQVKEMNCILQITTLSEKSEISLERFMEESLKIVIAALIEPKKCSARMRFRNLEAVVGNRPGNRSGIKRQLLYEDNPIGEIELFKASVENKNDFEREERNLVIVLSKYLGQILLRKESEIEMLKFKELVDQSQNAILITDAEGHLEYVNPSFTAIFGYEPQSLKGTVFEFASNHGENKNIYESLKSTLARQETWTGEIKAVKKGGQEVWTHATISPVKKNGTLINFVAQVKDISEEKKLSGKLEESRRDIELITSNSPNGIIILNNKMEINFANEKAAEILETSVDDLLGKDPLDYSHDEEKKRIKENFRNRVKKQTAPANSVIKVVTARNRVIDLQIMVSETTWKGEEAFLYNMIDVSAEKRMNRWLEYELEILRLIGEEIELKELLKRIFHILYRVEWIDCGGLYLINKEKKGIELIYHENLSDDFIGEVMFYDLHSAQFQMLLKQQAFFLVTDELPEGDIKLLYRKEGLLAVVALPLIYKNMPVGVFNLGSFTTDRIPEDDRSVLFNIVHSLSHLVARKL